MIGSNGWVVAMNATKVFDQPSIEDELQLDALRLGNVALRLP